MTTSAGFGGRDWYDPSRELDEAPGKDEGYDAQRDDPCRPRASGCREVGLGETLCGGVPESHRDHVAGEEQRNLEVA